MNIREKHRWLRLAGAAALVVALSGCAANVATRPGAAPYIGEFTGEFVDGKPLYRLPTIEVVATRKDAG